MIKRKRILLLFFFTVPVSCATTIAAHEHFIIQTYAEQHANPNYHIHIKYPVLTQSLYAKNINRVIHTTVDRKVKQIHDWMLNGEPPKTSSEFDSDVEVISHQQGRYSLVWFDTNYFAGAAHPEHVISPLNYDAKKNKRLSLPDMLSTKPGSLHHLSLLSRHSLRHQFQRVQYNPADNQLSEWFEQGTSPKLKNFKTWSFTPKKIYFYFPEYSIAPYVYGAFRVTIARQKNHQKDNFKKE
jgi:hypothetical protein